MRHPFKKKLIGVAVDPHDRRMTLLYETTEGFAAWEKSMQAFKESMKRCFFMGCKINTFSEKKVMGIQVCKAVIEDGVEDIDAFCQWKEKNPDEGVITWMP